ncbi:hypothetical protein [Jannaschia sp. R86511]|uniref:hypothetical protein n=1 Tax=Jannaschia sp. R86511 TaxID=3093853 RepID=UPI0036D2D1EA
MPDSSSPGKVSLDAFVQARLSEPSNGGIDPRVLAACHRILHARRSSATLSSTHRRTSEVALKQVASIWAGHRDYDTSWRP